MTTVTLMHPGAMGAAVAAQAVVAGHEVLRVPEGHSDAAHRRAKEAGATACDSLDEALARSEVALSICPPQAAEEVATAVTGHAFAGCTWTPTRAASQLIAAHRGGDQTGRHGPRRDDLRPAARRPADCPPLPRRRSHAVDTMEPLFQEGALHVRRTSGGVGSASALKMAFASFQKAARTLAESLRSADLPAKMAEAAVAVMSRWEADKDPYDPELADVLAHLRSQGAHRCIGATFTASKRRDGGRSRQESEGRARSAQWSQKK